MYIPKAVFPLASVGGSLVTYALSLIPLFVLVLIDGRPLTWSLFFLPVGLLLLLVFSTGMALLVSSLNVFYRDVYHIAEVVFIAWFYATPIIWPQNAAAKLVGPHLAMLSRWNPMAALIDCLREPIYAGTLPSAHSLAWASVCAFAVLAIGGLTFRRLESKFIFYL